MRARISARLVTATAVTLVAATLTAVGAESAHAATIAKPNANASFLVVYDNNIENLETPNDIGCPGNWTDLLAYMRAQQYAPDIFTTQQVTDATQAAAIARLLTANFASPTLSYKYLIAKSKPESQGTPCTEANGTISEKATQTNAIFYRADRFTVVTQGTWQSLSKPPPNSSCTLNSQDRTINIKARLHDQLSGKEVTVASIHWPTSTVGGGIDCDDENFALTKSHMTTGAFGGALRIFAGDTNVSDLNTDDGLRPWFSSALAGYTDAIYSLCAGALSCLHSNRTLTGGNRIDFIFGQGYAGGQLKAAMSSQHTISFAEARAAAHDPSTLDYSDHLAVRSYVHYP